MSLKTSKKELEAYLDFIKGSEHPTGYDQQKLLSEVFGRRIDDLRGYYLMALLTSGPDVALLSLFGTAFQMGREFESRRMQQVELEKLMK